MDRLLVTRSMIGEGLRALGVRPGGVLMFHARMSALGHVVGSEDTVLVSLRDAVGSDGTLMVLCGWADDTYEIEGWAEPRRAAYLAEMPAFDPAVSASDPDVGRLPERLRTWPGAERSDHPECSVAALGPRARYLVHPHPGNYGFGAETPFARLVEADGQVLMLGAPLGTLTLLHHAETIANAGPKLGVRYRMPVLRNGQRIWQEYADINSSTGAFDYAPWVPPGVDAFEQIARDALTNGVGTRGYVGEAQCYLYSARPLLRFATEWLAARFPGRG